MISDGGVLISLHVVQEQHRIAAVQVEIPIAEAHVELDRQSDLDGEFTGS